MALGIDAVLQELPGGVFDIQIGPDGDILTADAFDTAILVSLLADKRADESEVGPSDFRRGWIGNEVTPGFEIGSKLWIYYQSRLSRTVMNRVAQEATDALQWLVDDGYAVAIRATRLGLGTTGVTLEIEIQRSPSEVEKRFFELWQNTGV